jgi:hypothetical protein
MAFDLSPEIKNQMPMPNKKNEIKNQNCMNCASTLDPQHSSWPVNPAGPKVGDGGIVPAKIRYKITQIAGPIPIAIRREPIMTSILCKSALHDVR